jgi:hypothetical protein
VSAKKFVVPNEFAYTNLSPSETVPLTERLQQALTQFSQVVKKKVLNLHNDVDEEVDLFDGSVVMDALHIQQPFDDPRLLELLCLEGMSIMHWTSPLSEPVRCAVYADLGPDVASKITDDMHCIAIVHITKTDNGLIKSFIPMGFCLFTPSTSSASITHTSVFGEFSGISLMERLIQCVQVIHGQIWNTTSITWSVHQDDDHCHISSWCQRGFVRSDSDGRVTLTRSKILEIAPFNVRQAYLSLHQTTYAPTSATRSDKAIMKEVTNRMSECLIDLLKFARRRMRYMEHEVDEAESQLRRMICNVTYKLHDPLSPNLIEDTTFMKFKEQWDETILRMRVPLRDLTHYLCHHMPELNEGWGKNEWMSHISIFSTHLQLLQPFDLLLHDEVQQDYKFIPGDKSLWTLHCRACGSGVIEVPLEISYLMAILPAAVLMHSGIMPRSLSSIVDLLKDEADADLFVSPRLGVLGISLSLFLENSWTSSINS